MEPITNNDACAGPSCRFICIECNVDFQRAAEDTACPQCGYGAAADFAPFYIEQDPDEAEMMGRFEFGEGD